MRLIRELAAQFRQPPGDTVSEKTGRNRTATVRIDETMKRKRGKARLLRQNPARNDIIRLLELPGMGDEAIADTSPTNSIASGTSNTAFVGLKPMASPAMSPALTDLMRRMPCIARRIINNDQT